MCLPRLGPRHPDCWLSCPAGVLNHKYAGECTVRSAGIPYTVVRAVGLTTEDEDRSFLLEANQVTSLPCLPTCFQVHRPISVIILPPEPNRRALACCMFARAGA